jgi:hypothetical protein
MLLSMKRIYLLRNAVFKIRPSDYVFGKMGIRVSYVYFQLRTCSLLRFIVRSGLDVPTFATRRLHACHHARAPSGRRWNCGREMSCKFCLNANFHVTFKESFTCRKAKTWDQRLYFPYEGRSAEDFFALKIRRLRPGAYPRTWVPKARTLPLDHLYLHVYLACVQCRVFIAYPVIQRHKTTKP